MSTVGKSSRCSSGTAGQPVPNKQYQQPRPGAKNAAEPSEGQTIIGGCAAPLLIVYPQTKAQRFKLLRAGFIGSHFHFF